MARSKVKSMSHQDIANLHPLTNIPTKYQLPTPYSFQDIARTRFYRSRSPQPMSRPNTNILHLRIQRYSPEKLLPAAHPPIWTPLVKTIPTQPFKAVG